MNYRFKKICKLCLTAMAIGLISIGANAGENVYAESDAKKVVSISYETKTPVTINEGDDEYGRWNTTKKGEYFKYENCKGRNRNSNFRMHLTFA